MAKFTLNTHDVQMISKLKSITNDYLLSAVHILCCTRSPNRSLCDSAIILSRYLNITSEAEKDEITNILNKLIQSGYLEKKESGLLSACSDYIERLVEEFNLPSESAEILQKIKANNEHNSEVIFRGKVNDAEGLNYSTQIDILKTASKEILFPVLNMESYDELCDVFKNRAESGIKIKILAASEKIVCKVRGNSQRSTSNSWYQKLANHKNIEVREYNDISGVDISSSFLVDSDVLRYVIYDPYTQRSREGVLLEINSEKSYDLISIFEKKFFSIWNKAHKVKQHKLFKALSSNVAGFAYKCLTVTGFFILMELWQHSIVEKVSWLFIGSIGTMIVKNIISAFKWLVALFKNLQFKS